KSRTSSLAAPCDSSIAILAAKWIGQLYAIWERVKREDQDEPSNHFPARRRSGHKGNLPPHFRSSPRSDRSPVVSRAGRLVGYD
ncbi:MAG: hypothetical protein AB7V13_13535, partial [Pseudorhodoplanes sp.]